MKTKKEYLDKKIFSRYFLKLKTVYRLDFEFSKEIFDIYYQELLDLKDDKFIDTVNKIIKEQKEIYKNTNIIAMIRDYYNKNKKFDIEKKKKEEHEKREIIAKIDRMENRKEFLDNADNCIEDGITLTDKAIKYYKNNFLTRVKSTK